MSNYTAYAATQQGLVAHFYIDKMRSLPQPDAARSYLMEEIAELQYALVNEDSHQQLKEMADVMYTLYGYAIARGWNLHKAFGLVHESNMTKSQSPDGAKVPKGENYVAPDLSECI